ncbi:MAG TPA: hypothetical protein VFQ25_13170 [Ktedonobacterales bacterium]|nr:hypothetical protein [Ktedonobacterales bacterium]
MLWRAGVSSVAKFHRSPLIKASLLFNITVKDGKVTIIANTHALLPATPLGADVMVSDVAMTVLSGMGGHGIMVSNFVLTPMSS